MGLTTIWFAIAAVICMLLAIFHATLILQIIVFLFVSLVLLLFTRPFFIKKLKVGQTKTNIDSLPGKIGFVVKEIPPYETGFIKIDGQLWTAKNASDSVIGSGSKVVVIRVEGVKLIVEKIN